MIVQSDHKLKKNQIKLGNLCFVEGHYGLPHFSGDKAPSDVNSGENLAEYEFYLQKAIEPPRWAVSAIQKL